MAFCKYCGRQVAEGEICVCQMQNNNMASQNQAASMQQMGQVQYNQQMQQPNPMQYNQQIQYNQQMQQPGQMQYNQQMQQLSGQAKNVWAIFMRMIKDPGNEGVNYVRNANLVNAIIFIVLQGVFSGLFALFCVSKINSFIGLGGAFMAAYKFSGAAAFFLTVLYSAIFSVINAVLILGAVAIAKGQINFNKALSAASVRAVIHIPFVVIASIVFALKPSAGIGVFAVGFIACAMFQVFPLQGVDGISQSKIVYIIIAVTLISLIVYLVLAPKMAVSYVPATIKNDVQELFDELKDGISLDSLF